ncbi:MAG TPA: HesA/MoeB/ThiF family protein [bacterium]|nr:HesA/MoeB/ThiF family protein [bacterium]
MNAIGKTISGLSRGGLIAEEDLRAVAGRHAVSLREAHRAALELGIMPRRYARNMAALSTADQLRLHDAAVAVIGCGGLGGYIVEELARLGVGTIKIIDPDSFSEDNLNRQLYATRHSLGRSKAACAAQRVRQINPAIRVTAVKAALGRDNGVKLLERTQVAVDALDNISGRLELAQACRIHGIPLVHGSVGGWYGQVLTEYPGDGTLEKLYAHCHNDRGVEQEIGNLACAVAVIAGLQVAEAGKIVLGRPASLRSKVLFIDLLEMEFTEIAF